MMVRRSILMVAVVLSIASCDRSDGEARPADSPRIASFSPALTAMAVSLGLESSLVGRSAFCRIDPSLPVVGDLHEVDYERLVRLDPTHILVQSRSDLVDPGLRELSSARGWKLLASPLSGVEDIRTAYAAIPDHLFPPESDDHGRCLELVRAYTGRIDSALSHPVPSLQGRSVLILSPMEPPLAWGSGTWMDDMLTALGGRNAVQADGWVSLGWEDLIRIDADRIVFVSESELQPGGTLQSMLDRRTDGEVDILVHPQVHLPATSTDEIAAALRALLSRENGS
ncbi:MAG: ABC transporter substrate-binding protein [Planctomycetota bacterium]|nr:ABC transporter substrate-binding protein [Planctomycetota bacterium]